MLNFLAVVVLLLSAAPDFTNDKIDHTFIISFNNKVGNNDLHLDSQNYRNSFGEIFTVHQFKYYISNIELRDSISGDSEKFPDKYFLIDEGDSMSKIISLNTSLPHITSIKFMIGVDSLKNVSGVQSGDLDPAKGMFWTWNTGYIMAKLEGESPSAQTAGHRFSFHAGGYKKDENTARVVVLKLPQQQRNNVMIEADAAKWFDALHEIKIEAAPACHEPGKLAVMLADNYSEMFSIPQNK